MSRPLATASRPSSTPTDKPTLLVPRRRRRLPLRVVLPALLVVLVAVAMWLLAFSSLLSARQVEVSGTRLLAAQQVTDAAQVRLGVPLARQDVDGIATRVAGLREVESVRVTRDWPSSVRVVVVERTPVLAVPGPGGYQLTDRFGVAYTSVASVPEGVAVAQVSSAEPALLRQVNDVVQALPDPVARRVVTVTAESRDSITLVLRNSDQIFWGSAEQSALKAQVVVPLLQRPAAVYDVSAPANPATR